MSFGFSNMSYEDYILELKDTISKFMIQIIPNRQLSNIHHIVHYCHFKIQCAP